jgi:hypothetical protein
MYETIEMHVRGLIEDELPVPESRSFAEAESRAGATWDKSVVGKVVLPRAS